MFRINLSGRAKERESTKQRATRSMERQNSNTRLLGSKPSGRVFDKNAGKHFWTTKRPAGMRNMDVPNQSLRAQGLLQVIYEFTLT